MLQGDYAKLKSNEVAVQFKPGVSVSSTETENLCLRNVLTEVEKFISLLRASGLEQMR